MKQLNRKLAYSDATLYPYIHVIEPMRLQKLHSFFSYRRKVHPKLYRLHKEFVFQAAELDHYIQEFILAYPNSLVLRRFPLLKSCTYSFLVYQRIVPVKNPVSYIRDTILHDHTFWKLFEAYQQARDKLPYPGQNTTEWFRIALHRLNREIMVHYDTAKRPDFYRALKHSLQAFSERNGESLQEYLTSVKHLFSYIKKQKHTQRQVMKVVMECELSASEQEILKHFRYKLIYRKEAFVSC